MTLNVFILLYPWVWVVWPKGGVFGIEGGGGVFVKKGVRCDRTLRILSSNAPGINQNQ